MSDTSLKYAERLFATVLERLLRVENMLIKEEANHAPSK